MTKPHEEAWEVHPLDSRCVIDKADRIIADIRAPLNENGREVSALIAAAPEMTRALLANGSMRKNGDGLWHMDSCNEVHDGSKRCWAACRKARESLIKAGVLP